MLGCWTHEVHLTGRIWSFVEFASHSCRWVMSQPDLETRLVRRTSSGLDPCYCDALVSLLSLLKTAVTGC